jgi:ABC-type branched-subunit amino acid transport system substrate-binding protein
MTMRVRAACAVLLGVGLVAAACGGDDGGSGAGNDGRLIDRSVESAVAGASSTTQATVKEPTSMEEWEALWKTEREAIVAKIKQNGWGLQADGKTVLGPDGFKVDLSKCPAGWSNTEGLTDTEIKFGASAPSSGTAATGVYINQSMSVILDYYAEKGMFTDSLGKNRRVNQIIRDDGYDPARTIPNVDELIDSEKVFEVQTQGSPSTFKTYDKLNQRCIPDFFNTTGHPAWGDPVNHPWTTGFLFPYNIEALMWGDIVSQHASEFGDGKITVAALVMNNDFGKVYDQAFRAYIDQSPLKDRIDYVTELFEPQASTITTEMTTLASHNPDVFIGMLTGTPCAQSITESAQNGMNQSTKYKFLSIGCKSTTYVGRDAVGDASDGWWIVGGGMRDLASTSEDGNPYSIWARQLLASKGFDYKASGYYSWGLANGWSRAQTLMVAGMLPGGLTRANYLTAMRSMDMTPAAFHTGIRLTMSGNKDAYWVEGSEVGRYDVATQSFVLQGGVVDLSGKSAPCPWNMSASSCA